MGLNQVWDAKLYDNNHDFVSQYGRDLVELLEPGSGEVILDLGCGTGDLAKRISECGAKVIGVDESETMIDQAVDKYPELVFHVMDATELLFDEKFDAVFSNAVLHWITNPELLLQSVYGVLKREGRFVVEFGGKGNCQLITDGIIRAMTDLGFEYCEDNFPWFFPSIGEYATLLEKAGFQVDYAVHYARPTKLKGKDGLGSWMKMFASKMLTGIPEEQQAVITGRVEEQLYGKLYVEDNWYADYKRIRVVARKI